jgi:hypothetical protein
MQKIADKKIEEKLMKEQQLDDNASMRGTFLHLYSLAFFLTRLRYRRKHCGLDKYK